MLNFNKNAMKNRLIIKLFRLNDSKLQKNHHHFSSFSLLKSFRRSPGVFCLETQDLWWKIAKRGSVTF